MPVIGPVNEARLIEKLKAIEALYSGTDSKGEREAASRAKQRILARLREVEQTEPPIEYRFTMADVWSRRVFLALLRRYGLKPYRYRGQRYTSVMVKVSQPFVDETLWPEFEALSKELEGYLDAVTQRVVEQVLGDDGSDAQVVERKALAAGKPRR